MLYLLYALSLSLSDRLYQAGGPATKSNSFHFRTHGTLKMFERSASLYLIFSETSFLAFNLHVSLRSYGDDTP